MPNDQSAFREAMETEVSFALVQAGPLLGHSAGDRGTRPQARSLGDLPPANSLQELPSDQDWAR